MASHSGLAFKKKLLLRKRNEGKSFSASRGASQRLCVGGRWVSRCCCCFYQLWSPNSRTLTESRKKKVWEEFPPLFGGCCSCTAKLHGAASSSVSMPSDGSSSSSSLGGYYLYILCITYTAIYTYTYIQEYVWGWCWWSLTFAAAAFLVLPQTLWFLLVQTFLQIPQELKTTSERPFLNRTFFLLLFFL